MEVALRLILTLPFSPLLSSPLQFPEQGGVYKNSRKPLKSRLANPHLRLGPLLALYPAR